MSRVERVLRMFLVIFVLISIFIPLFILMQFELFYGDKMIILTSIIAGFGVAFSVGLIGDWAIRGIFGSGGKR